MAKQWYVIHTYSGHENKVKSNLEKKVQLEGLETYVSQVSIPSEEVAEIKDGKRRTTNRKVFPGYVLLEMDLPEGREMVMPGDNVVMDIELIAPIAMETGLRFAIREGGHTVGAGVVTEIIK